MKWYDQIPAFGLCLVFIWVVPGQLIFASIYPAMSE